jgi:hypothetical protein
MGLFDLFRRPRRTAVPPPGLLGRWQLTQADPALALDPGAVAEFTADGRLTYTVSAGDRDQIILLTYRVEGSMLVTDQPSAPREERTAFTLSSDELLLDHGGAVSRFERLPG